MKQQRIYKNNFLIFKKNQSIKFRQVRTGSQIPSGQRLPVCLPKKPPLLISMHGCGLRERGRERNLSTLSTFLIIIKISINTLLAVLTLCQALSL